jgi:hypothetical protein
VALSDDSLIPRFATIISNAMSILRRLRGVLGTAVTWALSFAGVGVVITTVALVALRVTGVLPPGSGGQAVAEGVAAVLRWATLGAASGASFAALILIAGDRRTLASLSSKRFAGWGFAAGAVGSAIAGAAVLSALHLTFPSVWLPVAWVGGIAAVGGALGSAMAAATLRAVRKDPLLHESSVAAISPVR